MADRDATQARRCYPARRAADRVSSALAAFDLAEYTTTARTTGRAQLPTRIRCEARTLYNLLSDFQREHSTVPRQLADTIELATRVLLPEWFLSETPFPRYRIYTNLGVLNWYLGTDRRTPYQAIWTRSATAIGVLLDDVLAFEARSLAGLEACGTDSFDRAAVVARVMQLAAISGASVSRARAATRVGDRPPADWQSYLSDSKAALTHLTALPLTREHDEYMFIRTLHISECCFWGILTAAMATAEQLKTGDVAVATRCLAVALPFAELLTPMIRALKTMSGSQFERFREATGAASALQSRTYQLMQIALTGAHSETIDIVAAVDELRELKSYDQPWYVTLSDLAPSPDTAPGSPLFALRQSLDALSRELRKWRKVHRGIVRGYLAARQQGTGGTTGADYLKHTVDTAIADRACAGRVRPGRRRRTFWTLTPEAGHARPVLTADL
jgi:tryptophan 2,3-dioxygenase